MKFIGGCLLIGFAVWSVVGGAWVIVRNAVNGVGSNDDDDRGGNTGGGDCFGA